MNRERLLFTVTESEIDDRGLMLKIAVNCVHALIFLAHKGYFAQYFLHKKKKWNSVDLRRIAKRSRNPHRRSPEVRSSALLN